MSDAVERIQRFYSQMLDSSQRLEDPAALARLAEEFFDPNVEVRQMSWLLGTAGTFRGYGGLLALTREVMEGFAAVTFVPEEIKEIGDRVAVAVLVSGTGRRSGASVEARIGHLFSLRDGRVVYWEVFASPSEALRAAELA